MCDNISDHPSPRFIRLSEDIGPFRNDTNTAGPTDVSRRVQLGLAELNSVTRSLRLHLEIGATWEMIPVWCLKMGGLYHVVSPKFAV
jgi:hypothetical protein